MLAMNSPIRLEQPNSFHPLQPSSSAKPGEFAPRSISASWQVNLVSSVGAHPLTRTTYAARKLRALSLKVSDEFTVPLCAIHHRQIHTTGKEREWWQEHNIDPKIANGLWQQSRERYPAAGGAALPELPEDGGGRGQSGTTQVSDEGSGPGAAAANSRSSR